MVQEIVIKDDRIFVLYYNSMIKIFSLDLHGNFTFEMKFKFAQIEIKNFTFIKEISTFIVLDKKGKLYSFYYPNINEMFKDTKDHEIDIALSEISGIDLTLKSVFYIKNFLMLLDIKDNFYFLTKDALAELNKVIVNDETKCVSQIKLFAIERNYGSIKTLSTSDNNITLIDENAKIYYINYLDLSKDAFTPKVIENFYVKGAVDVASGESHWMVLERDELKPIENWKEDDVMEWFKNMKLDDYLNIIKYEKINGKDILNADETFFVNVMGMQDDHINKIKYEINNVKYTKCKATKLWGWGSNKQGQLGLVNSKDTNTVFVKQPTLINLPDMNDNNDYIVKVYCGKTFSIVLTKFGEIYLTGNYDFKKKGNNVTIKTNSNEYKGKKNKTADKYRKESVNINYNRWINITQELCIDLFKDIDMGYKK